MPSNLQQLRAGIDPLTPLFVLIDPMVGEPLPGIGNPSPGVDPQPGRQQGWEREVIPVVLAYNIALPPHQHPYLVQLHSPDDPLLDLTLTIAGQERLASQAGGLDGTGGAAHRIGGWLQSSMRLPELSECVSALCQAKTEFVTTARYLRLADRRVLDLLRHIVGDSRVASQFGRLQRWTYLNAHAELCCLQSPKEQSEPLFLSGTEWQQSERGEMLHRTMAKFLGEPGCAEEPTRRVEYIDAEAALNDAAAAARRWPQRFSHRDDAAVWAALALWRPAMARLVSVQRLLDATGLESAPPEPLRYLHREIAMLIQQAEAPAPI